jgi:DNA-binding MarR family transcriptional regulator
MWENTGVSYVEDALLAMAQSGISVHDAGVDVLGSDDLVSNVSITALMLLFRDGSRSPRQIAEQTGLTSGGATKLITRLETAGLVTREAGAVPADGRAIVVSLTEFGREQTAGVVAVMAPHIDVLIDEIVALRANV